jgi:transposase
MGRSTEEETELSEHRKYRKFTAKQKLEIVLASLRGDRSIAELCREHDIAESLLREWRDQAVDAATERFEAGQERSLQSEQRRRIAQLERALGRKTYELQIAGEASHGRFAHPERCKWDAAGFAVRSSAMLRLG